MRQTLWVSTEEIQAAATIADRSAHPWPHTIAYPVGKDGIVVKFTTKGSAIIGHMDPKRGFVKIRAITADRLTRLARNGATTLPA